VAANAHRSRWWGKRRGGGRGVRPGGSAGGHAWFGTWPEGDPLGRRTGHHHGSRASGRPARGAGRRGQGGGTPGAAWRALCPWTNSNCPSLKAPNSRNLNYTRKSIDGTIVELSTLYTIDPNRAQVAFELMGENGCQSGGKLSPNEQ
jgi:hypothetical protein